MTTKQQQMYKRSLEMAKREGLEVCGHGTRKCDGAAVYAVPSRSQADVWHLVVVEGRMLVCDCPAATHGRYCAHRAAVRAELAAQAKHEREVEEAFHAAARALNVGLETAPALNRSPKPRDDTREFSLYR